MHYRKTFYFSRVFELNGAICERLFLLLSFLYFADVVFHILPPLPASLYIFARSLSDFFLKTNRLKPVPVPLRHRYASMA